MLTIDGFKIARLYRKHKDGGVCLIYYSEKLHIYEREDLKSDMEAIWIDLTIRSQKVLIGCFYRAPDDYGFYNKFYNSMEGIVKKRKNVVILGDFNSDLLTRGYEGRRLLRIHGSHDLHNVKDQGPHKGNRNNIYYY